MGARSFMNPLFVGARAAAEKAARFPESSQVGRGSAWSTRLAEGG
jgi:hypothetical protein